tara:strand:- start:156 stop:662 length:507 start_codon:yes stop_codon:yes gene_type:complete
LKEPNREETLDWLKKNSSTTIEAKLFSMASENGPLKITELIESGRLEKQHNFIANFLSLLTGKCAIQDTANSAIELGEHHSVDCLMQFLSKAMVMFLSNRVTDSYSSVESFVEILKDSSLSRRDLAIVLFRYYDQVAQAYTELSGSSNLNAQLIVESLIWQGSQLDLS